MERILLVYPEVPKNTFWSFKYALKLAGKKSAMPPLGLITVAALFPQRYQLKLVDMNIEPLKDHDVRWADAVFVSAMIVQKTSLQEVIATCNRIETPVVVGGPYATTSHQEISGVDHFVLGEVEDIFLDVLADLEKGEARAVYPASPRPDLSRTVVPRFDLLDLKSYASMAVQYSRGCPFKCEFCDIWAVYGNKPRVKHPDHFLAELDALHALGWQGAVFIVDDNFIGNKRRVKKELLPALIDWHRDHDYIFRFFTEASINMADDHRLLSLMRDAGFNEVFIGVETPSSRGLEETHKIQNLKIDMKEAIRTIQSYGIGVMAGFILGFDSDEDDIFERQISFIQETGIPRAMVGLLIVLPGTELSTRLAKEGRLVGMTEGNNTHSMETNFVTRMAPDQLREGYKKVLAAIYDSNMKNYFARCNTLLDSIGDTPFYRRDIHWDEMRTCAKSMFFQTFTPYGFQYLKFITRNMVKHRKSFSEAVALSVIGHHYYTITRETLKVENVSVALEESYAALREQIATHAALARDNYLEGVQQVVALWEKRGRILSEIGKKIDRIHIDFREDISQKFDDVSEQMKNLFTAFEDELGYLG